MMVSQLHLERGGGGGGVITDITGHPLICIFYSFKFLKREMMLSDETIHKAFRICEAL